MIETTETPEDVERLLAAAKKALQEFEDGVDYKRLLLRLRTASPAHPVLLARFLFGSLGVMCFLAGVVVMVIAAVNNDLARTLAKFEAIIEFVPEGVPVLPALLGVLAICMAIAWAMSTGAALAIGRDAQMLPWEQKQHQKLVNEVTRLTTQKAVMERIRSTPAGARPRIATPVPVSHRGRGGASAMARGGFTRTPGPSPYATGGGGGASGGSGGSGGGGFARAPGGTPMPSPYSGGTSGGSNDSGGSEPSQASGSRPAPSGGLAERARSGGAQAGAGHGTGRGGFGAPPTTGATGPAAARPAGVPLSPQGYSAPNPVPSNGGAGPAYAHDDVDLVEDEETTDPVPPPAGGVRLGSVQTNHAAPVEDYSDLIEVTPDAETAEDSGILAKARAGSLQGLRSTPYGSAGRVRPAPSGLGQSTRGGTPLGAPPKPGVAVGAKPKPRLAAPLGFPGTPDSATDRDQVPGGMFGTPPPITRSNTPDIQPLDGLDEVMVMEEEEDDAPTASGAPIDQGAKRRVPTWGPIEDEWLREALVKSEALVRSFPMQAYIEFSQEPNLPFTLVIARATPAMAVRAMVNFVEYLASIYTPPRARIELVNVAHLDRSFHKNVEAALEPYFGSNVEVEPNPGRVDILFTDPDPGWGAYPRLPMK